MPFQSEKQRRYMHANLPDIAKRWERDYSNGGIAELNAELNSLPEYYMPFPAAQGGRIGYDKGLKVWPKAEIIQSGSTPDSGIEISERDTTYGLEGLYQGDNLYAGGDFQTGNVKVKVQEDGNTVYTDRMSKDDLYNLYLGIGQKEGNHAELGTDGQGNWTLNIIRSFNQGGLIPSHEAGIYGLAEGGTPMLVAKRNDGQRPGYGWDPSGGAPQATESSSESVGGEGYQNVHQTGAITQTPGRTTTPTTDDKGGWTTDDAYFNQQKEKKATVGDSGESGKGFIGKITKKYPKFFQLDTAKKINQIKNMSWEKAWNLEKQMSQSWFGKGYTGADKVGKVKYFGEGIKSVFLDPSKWSSKIGGATPLAKKLAVLGAEKVLPAVLGGTNIISLPAAYVQGASVLQNFLESQGMPKGALSDDILARGAEAAGADVLSVPTDIYESSQDVPPEYSGTLELPPSEEKEEKYVPLKDQKFKWEGGIAGLKQGGRIGFFTGMREAEQEAQATESSSESVGGEGYQNVHQTGAVTQTPGRPVYQDRIIELQDRQRKQDLSDIIARGEEEKGPIEYYGQKKLSEKTQDYILKNLQKLDPDKYYKDMGIVQKAIEMGQSIPMPTLFGILKALYNENKLTSEGNALLEEWSPFIGGAPGTNPQAYDELWLALEKRKGKYRYDGDEDTGGDGITGVASIKYENIEEVNEDQMTRASADANRILEKVDRSKQDAYYAAFRQKYLMGDTEEPQLMSVAQGGRVPQGYNTGGLSNLFRLKNR